MFHTTADSSCKHCAPRGSFPPGLLTAIESCTAQRILGRT